MRKQLKALLLRIVKSVAIAAAIGGLTKLGDMLGLLGLSASTTAFFSVIIAQAVQELRVIDQG
jgi:NAD+--asparagine ADP-ribosyltransferase